MEKTCPRCGFSVGERWYIRYGIQKLDKGWGQVGIPVVGGFKLRRQALVMVYICELTNLPFLVALPRIK
ncbi:MAG: hypothetical protein ACLQEQ_02350 [Nitrososphaerales archaeon]